MQLDCIFCQIISRKISSEIILETSFSIVIKDIFPQAPIHYLIIPKKHLQDLYGCTNQDSDILADLMLIPAKLSVQVGKQVPFKLLANNGYAAGQRVFHLHFHFMADQSISK